MNPLPSPLILFGAQSGRPTEADVVRTLETAREAGYSDFMVYARSGLEIEYMGEEWLALVGHYLQHAERLGMGIWLYDEFNWPSGSCRGRVVTANPDFGNVTCAVYAQDDDSFRWRFFHAPSYSANIFDAEAMACFRSLTHEVYERRFRRYFGSTIRGMFTDEPGSGHWVELPPGSLVNFRWYRGLEADYRAETGRDFRTDVEAWCREIQCPKSEVRGRVWEDYTEVLGHAFRRAFIDPATAWADRLGIVSTGHLMNESSACGATSSNGLPLHVLKGMSRPGVDDIFTRTDTAGAEWLTLATAQHAIARTGGGGMAELFALGPADLAFDKMRQQIWLFALHKVDTYLMALHFQSPHGFVDKPHYAMFHSPVQPWFFDQAPFHDSARLAAEFARKPFRYDVAARYRERAAGRMVITGEERRKDLDELLRAVESHQFAVNLVEEDEPADEPIVFDFDDNEVFEERSGRRFASANEALVWLTEREPDAGDPSAPQPAPALERGARAADLVLRRYDDGSAALLNLREEDRTLVFVAGGARIPVILPARGIWIYRPVATTWAISLDRGNRRRIRFLDDGTARISVTEPVTVRFALCDIPGARGTVTLDGEPLAATRPCTFLGFGYDNGYRETAPVRLEAGVHVFTCAGREDRGLFLPVLWMEGMFAAAEDPAALRQQTVILPLPERIPCGPLSSTVLADFAGKVTYRAEVDIPPGAETIELGTGHAAASVRLGGQDLGLRLFAPWRYPVPPDLRGTRQTLDITLTTSVRPMFGAEAGAIPGALPSQCPGWVKMIHGEDPGLEFARWG